MSKVYPSLPPEIWIKIVELSYTKSEFTELWTSYRLVCRNLKDIVEHLFMDRHLKLITLDYMFEPVINRDGFQRVEILNFEFLHLSKDHLGVTLSANENSLNFGRYWGYNNIEELRGGFRETLKKAEKNVEKSILHPNHVLEIAQVSNDTPIPGLAIDTSLLQLTFDWKGMFSHFYGERKHISKAIPKTSCNRAEISPGVLAPFDRDNANWTQEGQWDQFYKEARRARISRMFAERGIAWNWDEMDQELQDLEDDQFEHLMVRMHHEDLEYNAGKR